MIRRVSPLIIFIVLAGILLWPVLFGGRVLLPGDMLGKTSPWNSVSAKTADVQWNALTWDSISYFYPSRALLGQAIRHGELPIWNPYQMCGTPFLANFQSAVLYPPNWLFGVIPADKAFGWLAFLHLLAAGGFTFIFLRGIGLSRSASTFGGSAFMLCGFVVVWLELPVFLSSAVWLPLALHFSHLAHANGQVRYTIPAGMAVALSLLGGHPQIAFYCWMTVALYWVFLGLTGRQVTSPFRSLVLACFTFAFGVCLAAPQLLPAMELAQLSHRGGTIPTAQGYTAYSVLAMPWQYMVSLFAPHFFGDPAKSAQTSFIEYSGYFGVVPLLLIGAAYRRKSTSPHVWFFSGLLALSLFMALGTGVNRLFYFWVPGFANSGSPARVLFLFSFAAITLASFGMDHIPMPRKGSTSIPLKLGVWPALLLVTGFGLAYAILRSVNDQASSAELFGAAASQVKVFVIIVLIGCGAVFAYMTRQITRDTAIVILMVVLFTDLLAFSRFYNPVSSRTQVYPRTATVDFLLKESDGARIMPLNDEWSLAEFPSAVLPPNAATVYGLRDVQGYDALYPVRYKALVDATAGRDSCPPENGNMVFARNPESPVYDLLGVKWFVSTKPIPDARRLDDGCYVAENKNALPRAFIVHTIEYSSDETDVVRMAVGDFDPRSVALVTSGETQKVDLWQSAPPTKSNSVPIADDVTIVRDGINTVSLSVAARKSGVLVLADQYYPGWKCRVDGKEVEVARVDYVLRGVAVPAGRHKVDFRFAPDSLDQGMRLMKAAFIVIICMMIYLLVRWLESRRPKPIEEPELDVYPEDSDFEEGD